MNRRKFLLNSLKISTLGLMADSLGASPLAPQVEASDNPPKISRTTFRGCSLPMLAAGLMNLPSGQDINSFPEPKLGQRIIQQAMEQGANVFDTAATYHHGTELPFLERCLRDWPRDAFFLSSKLPLQHIHSQEEATRELERQLNLCHSRHFDFFMIQALDEQGLDRLQSYNLPKLMQTWKRQGRIRFAGFAFADTPEILRQALELADWDFVQQAINAVDWIPCRIREIHALLLQRQIPIIAVDTLRGGDLDRPIPSLNLTPSTAMGTLSHRFAASLPGVLMTVSQPSSFRQFQQSLQTFRPFQPISPSEQQRLLSATRLALENGYLDPCGSCSCSTPNPCLDTRTASTCPFVAHHRKKKLNLFQTP